MRRWPTIPHNPYAVSALGGWHIEIVRGGGAILARMLYGATRRRGAGAVRPRGAGWRRAMSRCATRSRCRWRASMPRNTAPASSTELKAAIQDTRRTAYEKKIQGRAQELLGLFGPAPHEGFDAWCASIRAFP